MSNIEQFFSAWSEADATARLALIDGAYDPKGSYADPRSGGALSGVDAISEYVGAFSANAPGWTASVQKEDTIEGTTRATVAFGGMGPDGSEMVQHGQYFVEFSGDKIVRMIGFVGTGT